MSLSKYFIKVLGVDQILIKERSTPKKPDTSGMATLNIHGEKGNSKSRLLFAYCTTDLKTASVLSDDSFQLFEKMFQAMKLPDYHLIEISLTSEQGFDEFKKYVDTRYPTVVVLFGEVWKQWLLWNEEMMSSGRLLDSGSEIYWFWTSSPYELLQSPEKKRTAWLTLQKVMERLKH